MTGRLLPPQPWSIRTRLLLGVGAGLFVIPLVWTFTDTRGWGIGLAAGLYYVPLMAAGALSTERIQRWWARRPLLESLIVLPGLFFVFLLLFREAPWQKAALASIVMSAIVVPLRLRLRRQQRQHRSEEYDDEVSSHSRTQDQPDLWLLVIQAALVLAIVIVAMLVIGGLVKAFTYLFTYLLGGGL